MSVIDRYVARSFAGNFLLLLLTGIGLYILADLLVNLDEFAEGVGQPLGELLPSIVDYYVCNVPLYVAQLGAPLMAVAGAFTLGLMLKNNELTALVAAGTPLQRVAIPLMVCALLFTGGLLANQELIIPALAHRIAREHSEIASPRSGGVYCARDDRNVILTALRIDPAAGRLERVLIIEPPVGDRPHGLIEADRALWDPQRRIWKLERGRRIVMADPGAPAGLEQRIQYPPVGEYPYQLSPRELALRRSAQWADLLSVRQLNTLLASANLPNRGRLEMTRHVRLTQPLLHILMLLLSATFFLTCAPANVIAAGGRAVAGVGLLFGVTFLAHSTVNEGAWAPLMAWLPILAFGPVAVMRFGNLQT